MRPSLATLTAGRGVKLEHTVWKPLSHSQDIGAINVDAGAQEKGVINVS